MGLELSAVPPAVTFGIETGALAARDLVLRELGSRFVVEGVPVELNV